MEEIYERGRIFRKEKTRKMTRTNSLIIKTPYNRVDGSARSSDGVHLSNVNSRIPIKKITML